MYFAGRNNLAHGTASRRPVQLSTDTGNETRNITLTPHEKRLRNDLGLPICNKDGLLKLLSDIESIKEKKNILVSQYARIMYLSLIHI